jgi:hypothetical protein
MSFDRRRLLDFLEILDDEIEKKIIIVAVGGTAMALLNLKPSTVDIDFTAPSEDLAEFRKALKSVSHGFKVDTWPDGTVFSQTLPQDYLDKSIKIKTLRKIQLRALQPVDIVVTKIGRLDNRDLQDIGACIKRFKLTKRQIVSRASLVQYAGREEDYYTNLQCVIDNFFHSRHK